MIKASRNWINLRYSRFLSRCFSAEPESNAPCIRKPWYRLPDGQYKELWTDSRRLLVLNFEWPSHLVVQHLCSPRFRPVASCHDGVVRGSFTKFIHRFCNGTGGDALAFSPQVKTAFCLLKTCITGWRWIWPGFFRLLARGCGSQSMHIMHIMHIDCIG